MRARIVLAASAALLVVALLLGIALGTESVSPLHVFDAEDSVARAILLEARLPRVVLGAITGGGLAAAGVALQAVLRNPLAEPYVLGVSGGAALGATLAILTGIATVTVLGAALVPLAALAGGIGATLLVYTLARASADPTSNGILLAGIVVNAIASSIITFMKTLVSATKAQELLFWLMGFVDVHGWDRIAAAGIYVGLGVALLVADAGRFNLLALGEDGAAHLGVDVRALERRTFVVCSLIVGAVVSLTGLIGFVGLVVPHALRRLVGPDARVLIPASFLGGGAALVLCDLLSRLAFRWLHTEPPVGAVTALLGGPLFLVLLSRKRS